MNEKIAGWQPCYFYCASY